MPFCHISVEHSEEGLKQIRQVSLELPIQSACNTFHQSDDTILQPCMTPIVLDELKQIRKVRADMKLDDQDQKAHLLKVKVEVEQSSRLHDTQIHWHNLKERIQGWLL